MTLTKIWSSLFHRACCALTLAASLSFLFGCSGSSQFSQSSSSTPSSPTKTLSSLTISPANPSIILGGNQQFTASGTFSDGTKQDVTQSVSWTTAQSSVAIFNAGGMAVAQGPGTTAITASLGAVSGSDTLTVSSPAVSGATLTSLTVTPASSTIALGSGEQLSAIGNFSDGSTQDLSSSASWSSSAPSVASANNSGFSSAIGYGTATITATSGGISGTASVTVSVPPQLAVNYFDNNTAAGNEIVHVINPGTVSDAAPAGNLCAAIYVFQQEQLSECCSCVVTPDGGITVDVFTNLTKNPLLGVSPTSGVVKIVSSTPTSSGICDPTAITPTPALAAWESHVQASGVTTEEEFGDEVLSSAEQADLAEDCLVLEELGSGQGVCTCGTTF